MKLKFKVAVILALLIICLSVLSSCDMITYGSMEGDVVSGEAAVMSTENYDVSVSMMTYFFNLSYRDYAGKGVIDPSVSLNKQYLYDEYSWYDYILSSVKSEVRSYLIIAEAAKVDGIELDEDDLDGVEAVLDRLKEAAASRGFSVSDYIKLMFGTVVRIDDVRECLKLVRLSYKYSEAMMSRYKNDYTEADFFKQFEDNEKDYKYVDYYAYTFSAEADDDGTVTSEASSAAESLADGLMAARNVDEFRSYLKNHLTNKAQDVVEEGHNIDEDVITQAVDEAFIRHADHLTLTNISPALVEWAYDESTSVCSTIKINSGDREYTVYMLVAAPYRDEYITRSGAYIFLSNTTYSDVAGALAKSDVIIEEWENSEKTERAFAELARKYSESGNARIENNLKKDQAYSDWLYAVDRVVGDVGKIVSDRDGGVYLVYYAGESGLECWLADAQADLVEAAFNEHFAELADRYNVTVNDEEAERVMPVADVAFAGDG